MTTDRQPREYVPHGPVALAWARVRELEGQVRELRAELAARDRERATARDAATVAEQADREEQRAPNGEAPSRYAARHAASKTYR